MSSSQLGSMRGGSLLVRRGGDAGRSVPLSVLGRVSTPVVVASAPSLKSVVRVALACCLAPLRTRQPTRRGVVSVLPACESARTLP